MASGVIKKNTKLQHTDFTGTTDASTGNISTNLNTSDIVPIFAQSITSGGYAKFIEIYSTTTGQISLRQFPWSDLTAVEKGVQYKIRLYYLI